MSLTYPRPLPCGVQTVEFEIARGLSTNKLAGGGMQVREAAEPRWRAAITYAPMGRAKFQEVQAWLDTARGGLRPFLAHDPLKPYPLLYPKAQLEALTRAGGGTFAGGFGFVTGVTAATITASGFPAGFALKAGDMIGLAQGRWGLHRASEDVAASGGGILTVTVEPRVQTSLFGAGATAHVVRPECLMVLDAASVSASRSAASRAPISFSAIQVLA